MDEWARRAVAYIAGHARGAPVRPSWRTTLHFHPDREVAGTPILRQLAADGRYRSQFETGTSNGGLTAHPGGDRWAWESRLFGGAYDDAPPRARPVYGSLNHRHRRAGGSPRFGSAHLRLTASTMERTTFCYPDSVFGPVDVAVASACHLSELADAADPEDPLDDYVEAQIHGGVHLPNDVEALVLDPCHRGTSVEDDAHRLGVTIEYHQGFRLTIDELSNHPTYRGPEIVAAAARIARDGALNARVIGDAARAGLSDPHTLKRIWHCIARYGQPAIPDQAHT